MIHCQMNKDLQSSQIMKFPYHCYGQKTCHCYKASKYLHNLLHSFHCAHFIDTSLPLSRCLAVIKTRSGWERLGAATATRAHLILKQCFPFMHFFQRNFVQPTELFSSFRSKNRRRKSSYSLFSPLSYHCVRWTNCISLFFVVRWLTHRVLIMIHRVKLKWP